MGFTACTCTKPWNTPFKNPPESYQAVKINVDFIIPISVVLSDMISKMVPGYTLMMVFACIVFYHQRFLLHLVMMWTLLYYHMVEQMKSLVDENKIAKWLSLTTQYIAHHWQLKPSSCSGLICYNYGLEGLFIFMTTVYKEPSNYLFLKLYYQF